MAGSYLHVTTHAGNLRSNEGFVNHIENLGDAYEAVEEMYGMIWWMALNSTETESMPPEDVVELARQNYKVGLKEAKEYEYKTKKKD